MYDKTRMHCIPGECVPSAAVTVVGGSAPMHAGIHRGVSAPMHAGIHPPVNRMTNRQV